MWAQDDSAWAVLAGLQVLANLMGIALYLVPPGAAWSGSVQRPDPVRKG